MKEMTLVALGGALGALSRHGLVKALNSFNPHHTFSAGILAANLLGCALMGFLGVYATTLGQHYKEAFAALVLTGFLGSLTTFSTFILEIQKLSQTGEAKLLITHLLAHLALGLLGVFGGIKFAERVFTT